MPVKAPGARLDYGINWRTKGWLEADENIMASTWVVDDDTGAVDTPTHTVDMGKIWFADGLAGRSYRLTNHITTSKTRQDERSLIVPVDER